MSDLKTLATVFLLPFLIGCSTPQTQSIEEINPQEENKAQMVNMSTEEAFTCMGPPAKKAAEGKIEIWSYIFGACTVNLTIASDNKVKTITYTGADASKPADELLTKDGQCAKVPLITGCLRWLRK